MSGQARTPTLREIAERASDLYKFSPWSQSRPLAEVVEDALREAVAVETERCAGLCDAVIQTGEDADAWNAGWEAAAKDLAACIRYRGGPTGKGDAKP